MIQLIPTNPAKPRITQQSGIFQRPAKPPTEGFLRSKEVAFWEILSAKKAIGAERATASKNLNN